MIDIEILAPCGGPESVNAALCAGASAVYLGAKSFSARKNAANFSDDELEKAVRECHRHGVLVYLAFNTVIRDQELSKAYDLLELACSVGIDGLIIQDLALYEAVKAACPDMPLHASTQMTLHTPMGAMAAKRLGFSRVVAARELSLDAIRKMCETGIEIEAFAHGALCMCVSGQCYLSAMIGGRSANRGLCAGACRLPFSASGRRDAYALSLKDLSYVRRVGELIGAGAASLKIEGRMKRPEYVAAATSALKRAVCGEEYDEKNLRAVFSRSGFTDGYLDGKTGSDMFGARLKEDVVSAAEALPELRKIYEKPEKRFLLDMSFYAKKGEKMRLKARSGEFETDVSGDVPEPAKGGGTGEDKIREQLIKLGGTLYEPGKTAVKVDGGLYIPLAKINAMRREAVERLDDMRTAKLSAPVRFDRKKLVADFPMTLQLRHPRLRIRAENPEQISKISLKGETLVIPLSAAEDFLNAGYDPADCVLSLPRFDVDESATEKTLKFSKTVGYNKVECSNLGQIELARRLGLVPQGGFGLNITNSLASAHYFNEGVKTQLLSPELRAVQCSCIASPAERGEIIYGRLPLMIMRNCPIAAEVGCKRCTAKLTDRTGAEFPVICRKKIGVYELLNSAPIWMADRLGELNIDFGDILLTVETPDEAANVVELYRQKKEASGVFTRGAFYRGVE